MAACPSRRRWSTVPAPLPFPARRQAITASANYAAQGSFLASSATGTLAVNPKTASVAPNAATKIYGDANPTLTGTLSGFLPGDSVVASYSRTAGDAVLGTYTISATLSPAALLTNYAITYNTASFTITPKTASVTPDAKNKVYGSPDPALTGTLSGFLPADSLVASYSRVAGETVSGGPYTISAALTPTAVLSNYTITY